MRDKLSITRSLHDRLGLTESSQQDDNDYLGDREEYLYQVDGTMDIHTQTNHSADDEDTEPENNTCKRKRKYMCQ